MPTLCSCGCGGTVNLHFVQPDPEVAESTNQDQAGEAPGSPATPSAASD